MGPRMGIGFNAILLAVLKSRFALKRSRLRVKYGFPA